MECTCTLTRGKRKRGKSALCSFGPCVKTVAAHGLCSGHYSQKRRGKKLVPLRKRRSGQGCAFPGCTRSHAAKGLCAVHRRQQRKGQDLRPIGGNRIEVLPDESAFVFLLDLKGKEKASTRVSAQDLDFIRGRKWSLTSDGYVRCGCGQLMHRLLAQPPKGMEVDHINGNRLDNRRENLRVVKRSLGNQNLKGWSSSGYRNVHKKRDKWQVVVVACGTAHRGGVFEDIEEAAQAARELRQRLFTHNEESREGHAHPRTQSAAGGGDT